MRDKESQETFFAELNTDIECFFDMEKDTLGDDELSQMYPIQDKLKKKIDRYITPEQIGQGSKKYIYKVTDTKTDRPVAKAVLKKSDNIDSIEQFLREARLTSLLEHPNIIPIYDIGMEHGEPFFTMELMKGNMLSTIIKELYRKTPEYLEKYPQPVLLEIFSRICDAMAYAHSVQVIHLDLKPENIHVGEFGEALICDWGLAKILTEDEEPELDCLADPNEFNEMTLDGLIKGTPGFMAPEQCVSKGAKDQRTDVYALGAILYSLLTYSASINFSTDTKMMVQKTIEGQIIPPCTRRPALGISSRLESIVMKAIACRPEDRYQTVNDLRTDLSNYLQGFATSAENAGFITHALLLVRRHIITSSLIAAFLVIITALTLTFINELTIKERNAVTAQQNAETALKLLQQETKENQKLNNDVVGLIMDSSMPDELDAGINKIAVIDRALKTEIDDKYKDILWYEKGATHFINQEFNQAAKAFEHCSRKLSFRNIVKIAREKAQTKADETRLTDKELAFLVKKLSRLGRTFSFLMYENHMQYQKAKGITIKPEEHFPLVDAMLCAANNRWGPSLSKSRLTKNETGYSLDLSGTKFRHFHSPPRSMRNYLAALNLTSLNLSDSGFFELVEFRGLSGLTTLNLTNCKTPPLNHPQSGFLKRLGVKNLIIDIEKTSQRSLNALRRQMNVIDSKEEAKKSIKK